MEDNQIIQDITVKINRQKSGEQELSVTGRNRIGNSTVWELAAEGAEGRFAIEEKEGMLVGRIKLTLKSEAFRENDSLALLKPVTISIRPDRQPKRMTAMYLHRDWWTRPAFITGLDEMPDRTQVLYMDYGREKGCLLPMAGDTFKTMLYAGEPGILTLQMTAYAGGFLEAEETVFILTCQEDIAKAVHTAFAEAIQMKGIPAKEKRSYPEMFEYLGWCSWDAFYTDISETKMKDKARELGEKEIPARWLLMDDGWLSVHEQRLYDLSPEKEKFPNGLKQMIRDIKAGTQVDRIGVWHAFGGYWGGIEPGSAAAEKEKEHLFETIGGKLLPYPEAERGYGFYKDWYEMLREEGIDFVKVDGQSAIKNYYENTRSVCKAAKETHQALEAAAASYMGGRLINCMGMAMENILGRPGAGLTRNSDDFVPDKEDGFAEHLLQNAYNALYHDELYYCDWDMFWTSHPDAVKHGILRAVSGGPIYISDRIGETRTDMLRPLTYDDGRILRPDRTAKPSYDCIFENPEKQGLIKLTNLISREFLKGGVIAVYNIGTQTAETLVSIADIYDLHSDAERFFFYHFLEGRGEIRKRGEDFSVQLESGECALYLAVPIINGSAFLGLTDKYISFHALEAVNRGSDGASVIVHQQGEFAFYSEHEVKELRIDGEAVTSYRKEENLYRVTLTGKGKSTVTVKWSEDETVG